MKVIEKGHIYQPKNRAHRDDGIMNIETTDAKEITFVNKELGNEHDGTTTQEIIRILLDRTRHCANCMPHPNNERIVYHLRMALILHEARALERKVEKGYIKPEYIQVGNDGHLSLVKKFILPTDLDTTELIPYRHDWDRVCNHKKLDNE